MNTSISTTHPRLGWLAGGLGVGLIAAALISPAAVLGQSQTGNGDTVRSISVSGTGRVKAEPDVADIQLGVTKQGEDAEDAAAKAAKSMDAVVKALLGAGIAETDIQTTSLNLNPSYDYDNDPPRITGWQANNMVSITVRDIDMVGEVVDAATKAGATDINGISFRIEDPTEAQATARSAAVADARAKADQLAADAGVNIIGVITITEGGGQPPQPIYLQKSVAFDMAQEAAPSTPVLPGQVELSVDVSIVYEIE